MRGPLRWKRKRPGWCRVGGQRLHLLPADQEDEARLVMQDLEGNEFCLD